MSNELQFGLFCYVFIFITTILYGCIAWRCNSWLRSGIFGEACSLRVKNLVKRVPWTQPGNAEFTRVYERYKNKVPFCAMGHLRTLQPVAMSLDRNLEKVVFMHSCNEAQGHSIANNWRAFNSFMSNETQENSAFLAILTSEFLSSDIQSCWKLLLQLGNELSDIMMHGNTEINVKLSQVEKLYTRYILDAAGKFIFGLESLQAIENPQEEFNEIYSQLMELYRLHSATRNQLDWLPARIWQIWREHRLNASTFTFCSQKLNGCEQLEKKRNFTQLLVKLNQPKATKSSISTSTNIFLLVMAVLDEVLPNIILNVYELACDPLSQERLRQEIREYYKQFLMSPDLHHLDQMNYLNCLTAETQRKYCTLPRYLVQSVVHSFATQKPGYLLPKGSLLIIPIAPYCHDEDRFLHPEKWRPDRHNLLQEMQHFSTLVRGDQLSRSLKTFCNALTKAALVSLIRDHKLLCNGKDQLEVDTALPTVLMKEIAEVQIHIQRI